MEARYAIPARAPPRLLPPWMASYLLSFRRRGVERSIG
ncbi:hypothetical protein BRPE64_BCDS03160 [Caballeronia insecticola]|uniref:Uncharacterized protein n=1 Tax=Caballeronia insecticola TaxID=758793 RepID=R4X1F9_9BURK|nr:hypothetical protein BRPE64_BCDS03160 [Caballeronia insecticola]